LRIGRTLPPAASPIPLLDVLKAFIACLFRNGTEQNFIQEIKKSYGVKHCFLVSSGKVALTLILLALKEKYPDRKQVIIPAYTCFSVPAAIKRAGLEIRLCDLSPSSLDLDKEMLSNIIADDKKHENILCVIPTHLFGCLADINGIRKVVGPGITLVEDAAQAMGEGTKIGKVGSLGDIGFFSLGRGKALSTMEGGIIITNRNDLALTLESYLLKSLLKSTIAETVKSASKALLTVFLQYPSLFWIPKALPFLKLGETFYEPDFQLRRLSNLHINLTINWRKRLAQHRKARLKNVAYLHERLPSDISLPFREKNFSLIRFPVLAKNSTRRTLILENSEILGLGMMCTYPSTVNKIPELFSEFAGVEYPHAEEVCKRLFTIPVHEYVLDTDYNKILDTL